MKLLIVTQKVDENDDVLGFFHSWLLEFAKQVDRIEVICLWEGEHSLPSNVRVHSLGKERGAGKIRQFFTFYLLLFTLHRSYSAIFVHMNPIYLVLAGWYWRLFGRKTVLWYTHKNVDFKLKGAHIFANVIATASKESFTLRSNKVVVLGHGIDGKMFTRPGGYVRKHNGILLLLVGRITPIKNQILAVEVLYEIRARRIDARLQLLGAPISSSDYDYLKKVETKARDLELEKFVEFVGSIPNKETPKYYWEADVSLNPLPTGGLDKVVLESVVAGTPIVTTNKSFASLGISGIRVVEKSLDSITESVVSILNNNVVTDSRKILDDFSVQSIVNKIVRLYE